jgi:ubiquinone/menaquinone biosynthesis C-methylase UbiE
MKHPDEMSWFAPHLKVSIALLKLAGVNSASRIIDVGAGASTLIDDLLASGLRHITAVDISAAGLEVARQRLGPSAATVQWLVADASNLDLQPLNYDLWHDRATLHFLVDERDAAAYVASATRAMVAGGFAVIGGFASDGPERCSGLPVVRRDSQDVARLFGPAFTLVQSQREQHATPAGEAQFFVYTLLRKTGNP